MLLHVAAEAAVATASVVDAAAIAAAAFVDAAAAEATNIFI